jgi:hypothetical protein
VKHRKTGRELLRIIATVRGIWANWHVNACGATPSVRPWGAPYTAHPVAEIPVFACVADPTRHSIDFAVRADGRVVVPLPTTIATGLDATRPVSYAILSAEYGRSSEGFGHVETTGPG